MPHYTSAEVIQIIIALGTLFTIAGGVAVQIIMSLRNAGKIEAVNQKVANVDQKVDGAASASVAKIQNLQDNITTLVADAAIKKQDAAVLAESRKDDTVTVANTSDNPVPVAPTK